MSLGSFGGFSARAKICVSQTLNKFQRELEYILILQLCLCLLHIFVALKNEYRKYIFQMALVLLIYIRPFR